jgi:hypothetical protein
VRDASPTQRGSACQIRYVRHVGAAHDARVEDGDILEQAIEVNILLGMRVDQIVECVPGDREHAWPSSFASYKPFKR